ncbi:MAG: hypothetical protein JWM41_3813 [Gemmatimonadetes bacterium]|nr:hypothetical protein [Gemmatimonadota bacterium]
MPASTFAFLSEKTGLEFTEGKHLPVLVAQDCDVVHPHYSKEPTVEIVRGTIRKKIDGNLMFAKSGRRLHLEFLRHDGGAPLVLDLSIHERRSIDRRFLEDARPDTTVSITDDGKRTLAGWLAKRYRRDPFPDSFVERIKTQPQADALRDLLKEWGRSVSAISLALDTDEELPSYTPYRLVVYALVPAELYDAKQAEEELQDEFQPLFEQALKGFPGLDVTAVIVVSEGVFTVDDFKKTRRLDFDDLSFREPDAPEPAE